MAAERRHGCRRGGYERLRHKYRPRLSDIVVDRGLVLLAAAAFHKISPDPHVDSRRKKSGKHIPSAIPGCQDFAKLSQSLGQRHGEHIERVEVPDRRVALKHLSAIPAEPQKRI